MTETTFSRRQFLRSTARVGMAVALATALTPPALPVLAEESPALASSNDAQDPLTPEARAQLASGVGALWVAGKSLNAFAANLSFDNLPAGLKAKYRLAGGDYKALPAAEAIWKMIPASVRAGGAEALWKFHRGKDWSHIIPRSWNGPTAAPNGVWWSSEKNKSLGPNPMTAADLADARGALQAEAIKAAFQRTVRGMVKGGSVGLVVGGALAFLEDGLQYAEGKITRDEMVRKIAQSTLLAGAGGTIAVGLILGISLLFPFLIPLFLPVLFVGQMASVVFLGARLIELSKGWWEVLDGQRLLDASGDVLAKTKAFLSDANERVNRAYTEAKNGIYARLSSWVGRMARWIGLDAAWGYVYRLLPGLGLDSMSGWLSDQSRWVAEQVGAPLFYMGKWGYTSVITVSESAMRSSLAYVVTNQFQGAISTTDQLLGSIGEYRKGARRENAEALLIA